jgi:hypothetical protein
MAQRRAEHPSPNDNVVFREPNPKYCKTCEGGRAGGREFFCPPMPHAPRPPLCCKTYNVFPSREFFCFRIAMEPFYVLERSCDCVDFIGFKNEKQISRTRAESQQIVAQRPLSCVQYPVLYLSRLQRICPSRYLNLFSA